MKPFVTVLFIVCLAFVAFADTSKETEPKVQERTARAYMIYDPVGEEWYRKNALGFTEWGSQQTGAVWTMKSKAENTKATLLGDRGKRSKIKTFILLPFHGE